MNKNEKLYVKKCDCREIQEEWKPKVGDRYYGRFFKNTDCISVESVIWFGKILTRKTLIKDYIFLPSLEQLMAILGDGFVSLRRVGMSFHCSLLEFRSDKRNWFVDYTPKLACLRAVKEIRKEENAYT